jgi:(p)ppGpp synthase/HD superfamily hydrolase
MMDLKEFSDFARRAHDAANCKYDGKNYYTHVKMVEDSIDLYETVFKSHTDYRIARAAASGHDLIEDAKLTFNNIAEVSNKRVARVILAVTDVHEENRLLRHLFTMGKTVKDYIAIIVKMADMRSNGLYSKENGSSMYRKYVAEYEYRRPIFKMALKWYDSYLCMDVLEDFWTELDEIHGYKN